MSLINTRHIYICLKLFGKQFPFIPATYYSQELYHVTLFWKVIIQLPSQATGRRSPTVIVCCCRRISKKKKRKKNRTGHFSLRLRTTSKTADMFSFQVFDHPISRAFQNRFSTQYRCYSVSMLAGPNDRSDVEKGGKIIMPPSALDHLSRLNITYPMLFKLTNKNSDRMTHCGVLEFVADEGICYLPHWMMQNLLLEEGGLVQVESVNLMVATYSKFQPQSPDFLDITNPKAVLENALRNFACLTTGDVIAINYNEKIYELRVMETKPDKAVSIIECDMNVDFDAPLGYKEPERQPQHQEEPTEGEDHSSYADMDTGFRAFTGSGNRLDGKTKGIEPSPAPLDPSDIKRGIPNYDFKIGRITFIRNSKPQPKKFVDDDDAVNKFIAFSGEGQSLRKKGRKP
uniref:Ubiquitin recognition factor in ER-associated degradation protein 1 n=2 Tax=Takifugu TaxID=31032 RepID=A0A3B5KV77_TAKRU